MFRNEKILPNICIQFWLTRTTCLDQSDCMRVVIHLFNIVHQLQHRFGRVESRTSGLSKSEQMALHLRISEKSFLLYVYMNKCNSANFRSIGKPNKHSSCYRAKERSFANQLSKVLSLVKGMVKFRLRAVGELLLSLPKLVWLS